MLKLLLVCLGSGVGGVARFTLVNFIHKLFGKAFPYGTLTVNCLGSFLIGILFAILFSKTNDITQALFLLVIVGFLGGFTTFSTFSIETMYLFIDEKFYLAFLNVFLSIILCLSFTGLGIYLSKYFLKFF